MKNIFLITCRKIQCFSTKCINANAIFNKVCLELLNGMAESKTKLTRLN